MPDWSMEFRLRGVDVQPRETRESERPRPWARWAEVNRQCGLSLPEHGPWEQEPDRAGWFDESTGWPCMARRNQAGAWCGYVCVPRDHPYHGRDYEVLGWDDATETMRIEVHGGLTFAGSWFSEGDWWFGFDCSHAGDLTPALPAYPGDIYRTLEYVRREVTSLAHQLEDLM